MSDVLVRALVIGLGNPIMGDDGAGLAALARLRESYQVDPGVELVDGGTWGINLLPLIESTPHVVLLDAIDTASPPGTLTILAHDELPRVFQLKLSPHQVDFREVLGLAELRGTLPAGLVAIGVQPAQIDLHEGLSPPVEGAIDKMVRTAVGLLADRGFRCTRLREAAGA